MMRSLLLRKKHCKQADKIEEESAERRCSKQDRADGRHGSRNFQKGEYDHHSEEESDKCPLQKTLVKEAADSIRKRNILFAGG